MDNICHTLTGAALGEAGLKSRTRFAAATLMIAANLPDLDVLVYATPASPIAFRRGWTHGILAQVVLPLALTAVMMLIDRLRPHTQSAPRLRPAWVLLLAVVGVESHVFLDFLNNYGVRLLAPLDWRWLYGDAVFIVDPWLWLTLGAGVWLSNRRRSPRAARGALAFATAYTLVMLMSAQAARAVVARTWQQARGTTPVALMVGPRPVTPLTRDVIVDAGDHYETGTFSWIDRTVTFDGVATPKNAGDAAVRRAATLPPMRSFLTWARFPFWTVDRAGSGARVTVGDMRFAGFGALRAVGQRARFNATVVVAEPPPASQ